MDTPVKYATLIFCEELNGAGRLRRFTQIMFFFIAPMKYQMDRLCSYSLSFKLILSKTLKWPAMLLFSQMADIANTKSAVEMRDNFEFLVLN